MKRSITLVVALFFSALLLSQVERKVIVEHFTNSRCGTCAARNPAFYATLENYPEVLHVAYHPSSPYVSCVFSQHNPEENDDRTYHYSVYGGTPRAVIQGVVVPVQNPLVEPEQIESHLGKSSDFSLLVTNTQVSGNTYKATVTVERVSGTGSAPVVMFAGLAEEEVQYAAPNGEDLHHDVFRKRIFEGELELNPAKRSATYEFEYDMDPDWVEEEIFAYVTLQDKNSKLVLQAASSLDSPTGISKPKPKQLETILFPNPASATVALKTKYKDRFIKAQLYSLTGNLVRTFERIEIMDVSDLPPGLYFMLFTDTENHAYTTRLVKKTE